LISERQLSELFDSLWQQHFPLLNPSFIRRFNAEQQERVYTEDGAPVLPVPMGTGIQRFDLVAEVAFETAIERYKEAQGGYTADPAVATQRAMRKIALLNREPTVAPPSLPEAAEAERLLQVYASFLAPFVSREMTFKPIIRGSGILAAMEADFCTPEILFEVKAVHRNLHTTDLRQVICYLVAGLGSRQFAWSEYCVFNPRLAVYYHGRVDELLSYTSGRTPHDSISGFLDALMEREQPAENRF
jgi:hypothetical protein